MQHHLDVPAEPLLQSAVWRNDDLSIVLWFHGVVADELLDVVALPNSTAFDIWQQLHLLFRDNQAGRAVILGAEFRNLVQGISSSPSTVGVSSPSPRTSVPSASASPPAR